MTDLEEIYGDSPLGTQAQREVWARTVSLIRKAFREGREWDCYMLFESVESFEGRLWMNVQLGDAPKIRWSIKNFQNSERQANDGRISDLPDEQHES